MWLLLLRLRMTLYGDVNYSKKIYLSARNDLSPYEQLQMASAAVEKGPLFAEPGTAILAELITI